MSWQRCGVVSWSNWTIALALEAAELSIETKLALADGIMLATAHAHDADLWTQDSDFEGLEGVRYRAAE